MWPALILRVSKWLQKVSHQQRDADTMKKGDGSWYIVVLPIIFPNKFKLKVWFPPWSSKSNLGAPLGTTQVKVRALSPLAMCTKSFSCMCHHWCVKCVLLSLKGLCCCRCLYHHQPNVVTYHVNHNKFLWIRLTRSSFRLWLFLFLFLFWAYFVKNYAGLTILT